MDRLTKGELIHCDSCFDNGENTVCGSHYCENDCETCNVEQFYKRLAEYEDTGLTPEETKDLIRIKKALEGFGVLCERSVD